MKPKNAHRAAPIEEPVAAAPVEPELPAATPEVSVEQKAAEKVAVAQTMNSAWKSIGNMYVFVNEPQTEKALRTANKFAAEPKTRIVVFPTADEPDAKLYWGGINGFFFAVVVGVDVELPQSMAEHITKSRIANARVAQSLVIVNPFTGKPVQVNLDSAPEETKRRLGII